MKEQEAEITVMLISCWNLMDSLGTKRSSQWQSDPFPSTGMEGGKGKMASRPQCLGQWQLPAKAAGTCWWLAFGQGLELGTWPSSQEKVAGQLAGETWCLLTSAGAAGRLGWPHRQSRTTLLLLLWCWLQTGTRGICPEDVQDREMQFLRKKTPFIATPPKNTKENPKGEPPSPLPQLYGKSQERERPRERWEARELCLGDWLLQGTGTLLPPGSSWGCRTWKKQWQFWAQIDIGYNNNLGYPGHWWIWFLNFNSVLFIMLAYFC